MVAPETWVPRQKLPQNTLILTALGPEQINFCADNFFRSPQLMVGIEIATIPAWT